jgi:hypothetical protein
MPWSARRIDLTVPFYFRSLHSGLHGFGSFQHSRFLNGRRFLHDERNFAAAKNRASSPTVVLVLKSKILFLKDRRKPFQYYF